MKRSLLLTRCGLSLAATTLAALGCASVHHDVPRAEQSSKTYLSDPAQLAEARSRTQANDPLLAPAVANLIADAEKAIGLGPFTVTAKSLVPRSGDRHDYMSVSPYWWPNPDKADGLPYVRRDGEFNPERENYDNVALEKMSRAVQSLALAYFFTGEERYAERAAMLLRVWFLEETTRMNPNLNYGQAIPGLVSGRSTGIIDTLCLPPLVDAVGVLSGSPAWREEDQAGLEAWFEQYLDWLLTSRHGKAEARAKNNHGTCYDVQVVSYALFTRNDKLARQVLKEAREKRIAAQIEPDGRQPKELERTRSFSYTAKNLQALAELADLGRGVGVDLWHFETRDGRGIRKALDWALRHGFGEREWPFEQLGGLNRRRMVPVLRRAAIAYSDTGYEQLIGVAADDWRGDRVNLTLYDPIIEQARGDSR